MKKSERVEVEVRVGKTKVAIDLVAPPGRLKPLLRRGELVGPDEIAMVRRIKNRDNTWLINEVRSDGDQMTMGVEKDIFQAVKSAYFLAGEYQLLRGPARIEWYWVEERAKDGYCQESYVLQGAAGRGSPAEREIRLTAIGGVTRRVG